MKFKICSPTRPVSSSEPDVQTTVSLTPFSNNCRDTSMTPSFDNNYIPHTCELQWSSGSTLACGTRDHRFESCFGQMLVFSRKSLLYTALGTGCTLTAVLMSTQPSTLRGTVNEYQTLWLNNNTWRWVNVRQIAAYTGGLRGQVCSLACELAATWR